MTELVCRSLDYTHRLIVAAAIIRRSCPGNFY